VEYELAAPFNFMIHRDAVASDRVSAKLSWEAPEERITEFEIRLV